MHCNGAQFLIVVAFSSDAMSMTMQKAASLLEKLKSSEVRAAVLIVHKSGCDITQKRSCSVATSRQRFPPPPFLIRAQVLIERRLRWVKRKLQEGDDEGLQVEARPKHY
jgi:hypothetical protein